MLQNERKGNREFPPLLIRLSVVINSVASRNVYRPMIVANRECLTSHMQMLVWITGKSTIQSDDALCLASSGDEAPLRGNGREETRSQPMAGL